MFVQDYEKEKQALATELQFSWHDANESEDITKAFAAISLYFNCYRDNAPDKTYIEERKLIDIITHMLSTDIGIVEDIVRILQRVVTLAKAAKIND